MEKNKVNGAFPIAKSNGEVENDNNNLNMENEIWRGLYRKRDQ